MSGFAAKLGAVCLLAAFFCSIATAQTAAYLGQPLGGGFSDPFGVAVDGSGNVYVADQGNSAVKEMPAGCASSSCVITLGGGFSAPQGVAVDGSGNVYVADQGHNAVKEMANTCTATLYSSSGCTVTTLGGGFSHPNGVAVDGSGNVYVADNGNSAVKKMANTCTATLYSSSGCTVTTLGGGFSYPGGLAVDSSGNVYVGDFSNNAVKKMANTCTATLYSSSGCTVTTLGGGFSDPTGVAVDGSGNVYVADQGNSAVKKMANTCTATLYSSSGCTVTMLGGGFRYPSGVAVDGSGNVYVADQVNNAVKEMVRHGVSFTSTNVGSSTTQTLTFTIYSSGTIGVPAVLTQGATGLDFTDTGNGTCTTTNGSGNTYDANATCTVIVEFTPKYAGVRYGAVQLVNNSNAVLATVYLTGIGTGPLAALYPGTQSALVGVSPASPLSNPLALKTPYGMAVDSFGNVYIADNNNNRVLKVPPTDPTCATSCTTIGTGLSLPISVAVDGAGNVYIADAYNGRVLLETLSGGSYTQSVVANRSSNGLSYPYGVAVDGSGNVYIADYGNSQVFLETLSGGSYTQSVLLNSSLNGLNGPTGVAVDAGGNLYIADIGNSRVLKETYAGGGYTQSVVANSSSNGLYHPQGVAVDGSGNVYIADTSNNRVLLETLSGGSYTQSVIATHDVPKSNSLSSPTGVAVDGSGNVYIADYSNNMVLKLDVADPQTASFVTTTAVGSTDTTDGAQTLTLENIGNAALTFTVPGSGNNPSIAPGFSLNGSGDSACPVTASGAGSPGSLAQGTSCTVAIDFAPVAAGSISGSLVFTDNSAVATQTISLSGTATQQTPTFGAMSFSPAATEAYGASQIVTISDTLVYIGSGAVPAGAVTFVLNGVSYTASCAGSSSPLTCTYAVPAATIAALPLTAYTVTAAYTADSNYTAATGASGTFTITQATQAIAFTPSTPVTYGVSPITLAATGGASGLPVVFTIVSGPGSITGSTLTVTGAGTIVIAANQAGNTNYAAATAVQQSIVVNQTAQTITFTPLSPVTYGVSPITLAATGGASGLPVVFTIVSGPGSITGSTLTVTGAGTIVIAANQAGNTNYAAATAVQQSIVVNQTAQTVTSVSAVTAAYGSTTGITVTASESGSAGVVTGGVVTFSVISPATGSFNPATCTLSVAGACTTTYTPNGTLSAGTYAGDIKASFAAVGNYKAASGAATLTVNQATPGITLAASVNPTLVQSAITFTATVTSAIGTPTGTVIFMDGSTPLGTGTIASGVAAFTTSTLAVGAHTITAVYSGDANFITATSSAQTETVLDFSLNISTGTGTGSVTSATVQPGGTAVFTVTISPVGSTAFRATIMLSASGLPPGATYVISPATLIAGSGTQTVTLTIQLPPSIAALHHGNGMNQIAPFALALLFLPFAGLMRKHAKRFGRTTWIVLLLIASAATIAGVAGCGGFFVQPPATYTVSLTGTSGNLSYSTPLTLTVE